MRTRLIPLLVLSFLAASCSVFGPEDARVLRALTADESSVVEADNRFGLRLFGTLSAETPEANVFISPLSVSMALGMTLNGAAGETRAAMERTLALHGLTPEQINQAYHGLIDLLRGLDPDVLFYLANSIWYRQGVPVEPAFLETNRTYFDAEVAALDFANPASVDVINRWVDTRTRGTIEQIIDQISPDVVLYLINAIYFKGTWRYAFDPSDTHEAPFHNLDGSTSMVPMMRLDADLDVVHAGDVRAVELPYGDGHYAMTLVLPGDDLPLDSLVARLDATTWADWTSRLTKVPSVTVYLPRFKVEYREELSTVLSALGMGEAFDPSAADFSGIHASGGLYLSGVFHKTFVDVDEKGTEAAAVTAVEVRETSVGHDAVFRFDRPFLYLIRERHSGTILFVGKMVRM